MFVPLSFIKLREKLYFQELEPVNLCNQCVRASRKSRMFIRAYTRNTQIVHCTHWVLAQFVYALQTACWS